MQNQAFQLDVCGRLPALVVLEQLNIATVATVGFAESGVPAGCLRTLLRWYRHFRPPSAPPGAGRDQSQIRVPGCRIRAWTLNFQGSPLPRPGHCTCLRRFARRPRALPDVCGRLRSLLAPLRMSAAVCSFWLTDRREPFQFFLSVVRSHHLTTILISF